jgi:uncharacterized protein
MMNIGYKYKPVLFFVITYLITWGSWFLAAFYSYQPGGDSIFVIFMLPGLVAPFGVALGMILTSGSSALKKQFVDRLVNLRLIRPSSILPLILIMPAVVVVSILLSTFLGQSIDQLRLAEEFSFTAGYVPVLIVLILAASFEELGWRSYAMDSLRSKFNYFWATMVFAFLWAFWHFPLFFINNYYQNELVKTNILFAVTFMVSIFPIAFIISWLCRKNSSSILVAILFHFFINIGQEALQMGQVAKCIETVLLMGVAVVVVLLNKRMFFDEQDQEAVRNPSV